VTEPTTQERAPAGEDRAAPGDLRGEAQQQRIAYRYAIRADEHNPLVSIVELEPRRLSANDISRYHEIVPDVLIRDVPAEDLARIDAHAARLGLSRTEYLRRRLRQEAARPVGPVTTADLQRFAARFADLGDPEVMRRAWS
jgi:hypothetical protein